MPMMPNLMALQMKSDLNGCTSDGLSKMWDSVCSYVKSNAQVFYSWIAVSASVPPTPDPMVVITASIDTSFDTGLNIPGLDQITDSTTALNAIGAAMNLAAASWMIKFPTGFLVSPCLVIPSIVLTPSMATDQMSALTAICTSIIAGIKLATPAMAGSHSGVYTGAGVFTSII